MPEGDTIARAARTLQRALAGQTVTAFESAYPALTRVSDDHPIVGRTIDAVTARGKHLLIAFSGGLTLRTHMRMHGAWHLYRPGERWRRPARQIRLLVATGAFVAVGFDVPDAELLGAAALARHRQLGALGPDLLDPAFDRDEALRRMRSHPREPIAGVLLNQRVVAGIGNVFKSEILFVAGVNPFVRTADLSDECLRRLVEVAQRQLRTNVEDRARTLAPAFGRRTTGSLHPSKALWVYGRAGQPCRQCETPIALDKRSPDARLTYWCRQCQTEGPGCRLRA